MSDTVSTCCVRLGAQANFFYHCNRGYNYGCEEKSEEESSEEEGEKEGSEKGSEEESQAEEKVDFSANSFERRDAHKNGYVIGASGRF